MAYNDTNQIAVSLTTRRRWWRWWWVPVVVFVIWWVTKGGCTPTASAVYRAPDAGPGSQAPTSRPVEDEDKGFPVLVGIAGRYAIYNFREQEVILEVGQSYRAWTLVSIGLRDATIADKRTRSAVNQFVAVPTRRPSNGGRSVQGSGAPAPSRFK